MTSGDTFVYIRVISDEYEFDADAAKDDQLIEELFEAIYKCELCGAEFPQKSECEHFSRSCFFCLCCGCVRYLCSSIHLCVVVI